MTAIELHTLRRALALTQTQFGAALGVSRNTIGRWESGQWAIPAMVGPACSALLTRNRPRKGSTLPQETRS